MLLDLKWLSGRMIRPIVYAFTLSRDQPRFCCLFIQDSKEKKKLIQVS